MTFFESIFYMAWRGIAIGLIISAPMGPVGMLCIQRTLDKGRRAGLFTGIGAAISDLFYSLLTGFGLSFIEDFLERNQNIIQLIGSFVLIGFGVYLFRKNPSKGLKKPVDETVSVKKSILGGFLFTFSNPLILFLIVGLFARFNFILPADSGGRHAFEYIVGFIFIFLGALLWWWFITFSIDKVRSHFNIRSMWLINKIIGAIILLFAVVGIFTSVSALAKAEDVSCWNAGRGYGPFAAGDEGMNHLKNQTADTISFMAPCGSADGMEFRARVHSIKPSKPWGMMVKGCSPTQGEATIYIDVRAVEGEHDGFSSAPALELALRLSPQGIETSRKSFADNTGLFRKLSSGTGGPDPTGSLNFFKLTAYADALHIFGGIHTPELLISAPLPEGFRIDSVGFYVGPGAEIHPDQLRLSTVNYDTYMTRWADTGELTDHLALSRDWMEGYWQTLDRSLEESLLRLGGDYRYALVKEGDGYDLVYLSGAKVNADAWQPGMLKASLRQSGIPGVWDVTWIDAMHTPMAHELKAQTDRDGVLTIQFPYQGSTMRLYKTGTQPF